jgi:hypothetical protein
MTVQGILADISLGKIALADFQRDFDWSTSAMRSFLATILMGWPAGSLLGLEGDPAELEIRPFEGGPDLDRTKVELIVLDGQQRITSLLHTVTSAQPRPPASQTHVDVPLSAFSSGSVDDIEEGLTLRKQPFETPAAAPTTPQRLLIPLETLVSPQSFFAWRDSMLGDPPDEELSFLLSQAYRDHLHWLHDYEFPLVTLDKSVDEASVSRIFERVNRSGLRLGSFDLVVARAYSADWNLRDLWAEARLAHPLLDHFLGDDGLPVLQTIALRHDHNVRQSAVLDLDAPVVAQTWPQAVEAVDEALRFLAIECGVARPEWLPYRAHVLVLAALALDHPLREYAAVLRRYAVSRAFALRFDVAANTRVVEDYRMLQGVLAGEDLSPIARADDRDLIGATRQRRGALWRAFMCVLGLNGARDLLGHQMRLVTLPLEGASSLDLPEGRSIPLVPRGDGWHLRALASALGSPESATEIHSVLAADGMAGLGKIKLDAHALETQFLPPIHDLASLETPQDLLLERLERLASWLDETYGMTGPARVR